MLFRSEVRNQAETLVYETEKNLKDLDGKLSPEEVSKITNAKDELQKALNAGTTEEVKAKMEALTNEYHIISTKLYEQAQQAQAGQSAGPDMGAQGAYTQEEPKQKNNDDNVVDADFEVVDD